MPDELWREAQILYRTQGARPTPPEKKCIEAKWLSEEALQIAEKRREVKGKGKRGKHTQLNAEFQRITRRDKKDFLSKKYKKKK